MLTLSLTHLTFVLLTLINLLIINPYSTPMNPLQSLERLIFKMKVMVNHSSATKARGGKGAGGGDSGTGRGGSTNKTVWVGNLKIRKIDGSGT